jgi:membrane associated rhomboid family serine protease
VSYGIVALCFVVFTGFELFSDEEKRMAELHRIHHELSEHLARHPYLTIPPALTQYLPTEMLDALARARSRAERHGEMPPPELLAAFQSRLNELAERLEEQVRTLPSQRFGYVPSSPRPWTLLTSMFMHGGWMHLLGNMLFFFLSGPFIEDVYGRLIFAGFYLAAGVFSTLSHALAYPETAAALVGASGAIAGVMGSFLVRYGTRRIAFLFIPIPILPTIRTHFLMPAYVVLPFWLGQQLLFAHADVDATGVAWWAHIGGFGFGASVALMMRAARIEERFVNPAIERRTSFEAHPSLERIVDARVAGRLEEAQAELEKVLRSQSGNIDAWTEAYELGLARRDPQAVGRAVVRMLELYNRAGETDLAFQVANDQRWSEVHPVSPQLCFSAGALLEKHGDIRRALELYENVVRSFPKDPKAIRALLRRGELLVSAGNLREARRSYESVREHPAYGPLWSDIVERGLQSIARQSEGVDSKADGPKSASNAGQDRRRPG